MYVSNLLPQGRQDVVTMATQRTGSVCYQTELVKEL